MRAASCTVREVGGRGLAHAASFDLISGTAFCNYFGMLSSSLQCCSSTSVLLLYVPPVVLLVGHAPSQVLHCAHNFRYELAVR